MWKYVRSLRNWYFERCYGNAFVTKNVILDTLKIIFDIPFVAILWNSSIWNHFFRAHLEVKTVHFVVRPLEIFNEVFNFLKSIWNLLARGWNWTSALATRRTPSSSFELKLGGVVDNFERSSPRRQAAKKAEYVLVARDNLFVFKGWR